jgi:hypothetical protein
VWTVNPHNRSTHNENRDESAWLWDTAGEIRIVGLKCLPYLLRHVLCRFLKTRSADSASGFRPPNVLVLLQFESQPKSSDEIG